MQTTTDFSLLHELVDNVDLPSNEFDLRSLNSDEAFVVIEEQVSGTLREELVHAEFIVGEETKIFDKILGLSQKGRLRTAIEKFLTERLVKTLVNSGGQMKNLLIFLLFFPSLCFLTRYCCKNRSKVIVSQVEAMRAIRI